MATAHARTLLRKGAVALLALFTVLCSVAMGACMLAPARAQGAAAVEAQAWPLIANQHQFTLRREAQRVWGLGAPVATLAAQIQQESGWNPQAVSRVGAQGLAQFMPATARWMATQDAELRVLAPFNPAWALRAVAVYDHHLWQQIDGAASPCERMAFALAAYNGGLGWVNKRRKLAQWHGADPSRCLGQACTVNPGINPANQTENERYPIRILAREKVYARWGALTCPG